MNNTGLEMLENWRECKLGDVIDIKHGYAFKGDNITTNPTSDILVTPGNFNIGGGFKSSKFKYYNGDYPQDYVFNQGDIIVSMTDLSKEGDTLGYSAKIPKCNNYKYLHNQRIGLVKVASNNVDKDFIYWLMRTYEYQAFIVCAATGTSIRHTSPKLIKEYKFELPPLQEQKAIAEILSSLDDKIDLLHRQNHTLESIAQTLFRQWFIEEAKENRTGKFRDWIEDTIGGDWGKENPTEEFKTVVHCIRGTDIADLNNGLPTRTPLRYIKNKKLENIELKEGDIIFEISGGTENQSTGRTTYINQEIKQLFKHPIVFSNFCRLIRPKKKEYCYFIYLYFQYLYTNDEFFGLENGTSGIKNLNYKALLNDLEYQMPTEAKVLEFHNNTKNFFQKIGKNKLQIQTLENLRDTLLPKLISGEVRVAI